jgi:spermidine/putrescine transport system substrate-binding protein
MNDSSRRAFLGTVGAGALTAAAGCVGGLTGSSSGGTLRLIDWDYVYNDDAIAGFEERTGIEVDRQSAQSSAQSLSLLRSDRSDHDIIALGNYAVTPALEEGLIQPVDLDQIPAYDDVFGFLKKDYFEQDGEVYGVPRSFGQTPLAVNTELVDKEVTSLSSLFDPELSGLVGGRDDARLQFLYDRAANGEAPLNPASADEVDFEAAKERLRQHVEFSGGLWSSGGDSEQLMRSEQVGVQPVWNYVTISLQNDGLPVEKVYPEEGTKAWFIQFCVREGAENVEEAHAFIQDWHENMGYDSLMAPFSIAIPNDRVFEDNDVDRTTYGLDDPDQFIYEDPKPQELVRRYTEVWNEAKNEAGT